MSRSFATRLGALAITIVSTFAMLGVSFEAEAQRRMGGGGSFGRQSSNITQQRQAVTPPAARSTQSQQAAPNSTAARQGQASAAPARTGASRWLGPIAGIAAGLGIAALLSSLGLGAAAAEFIGSLLLIALVVFAVLFLVRRLRGAGRQPAMQGAHQSNATTMHREVQQPPMFSPDPEPVHPAVANTVAPADVVQDERWFIPADFDTQTFLQHAKQHFIDLQAAWDKNDLNLMREFMTDELVNALKEPLAAREPGGTTDVILLNAHLLGIEKVDDGNMASVRFSGMLRDDSEPEAYRFEEVWNFLKPTSGGWVLAGIQQIPVEHEA